MVLDIKLDFENKKLVNEYVNSTERILQQIKIAVRIFKNHWYFARDYGVSYAENSSRSKIITREVREMIEQVPGVDKVKTISVEEQFDRYGNGYFIISADINLISETIRLEKERIS